ncbi:hypothetical protein C0J52_00949 [Blattella germanica]|nr:hypothetical protein C0J52_00949 [Blattella germanica]
MNRQRVEPIFSFVESYFGNNKTQILQRQACEIIFKVYLYLISVQRQTLKQDDSEEDNVATSQQNMVAKC